MTDARVAELETEAAAEATRVLAQVPSWLWDGERLPVPVEAIVDNVYGLQVRDVDDIASAAGAPELAAGQSLSGLLLADVGEIWVNAVEAREWPPRRRFTIGHELGHWVMHTRGSERIFCRVPSAAPDLAVERPALPDVEVAANAFAAELLLPEHRVRAVHAQLDGVFEAIMAAFYVSGAALERRLRRLGLSVSPRPGAGGSGPEQITT